MINRIFRVAFGIASGVFGTLAYIGFFYVEIVDRTVCGIGALFFLLVGLWIIDLPKSE